MFVLICFISRQNSWFWNAENNAKVYWINGDYLVKFLTRVFCKWIVGPFFLNIYHYIKTIRVIVNLLIIWKQWLKLLFRHEGVTALFSSRQTLEDNSKSCVIGHCYHNFWTQQHLIFVYRWLVERISYCFLRGKLQQAGTSYTQYRIRCVEWVYTYLISDL